MKNILHYCKNIENKNKNYSNLKDKKIKKILISQGDFSIALKIFRCKKNSEKN
jgi:hypothetical protein